VDFATKNNFNNTLLAISTTQFADSTEMSSAESTTIIRTQQQQHFESNITNESFGFKRSHEASSSRQCRGSLPLKKRRFHEITSAFHNHHRHISSSAGTEIDHEGSSALSSSAALTATSVEQNTLAAAATARRNEFEQLVSNSCNSVSADEKLAALALVAAAAATASIPLCASSAAASSLNNAMAVTQALSLHSAYVPTASATAIMTSSSALQQNQLPLKLSHEELQKIEILCGQKKDSQTRVKATMITSGKPTLVTSATTAASVVKGTATQRQRVNHPPLIAPIPGGCHGRTSRNNSFCRRTPCYNGSKYCKLHYQQYVVNGDKIGANGSTKNGPPGGKVVDHRFVKGTAEDGRSATSFSKIQTLSNNNSDETTTTTTQVGGGGSSVNFEGDHTQSSTNSGNHHHRHHQDKRYTGLCANEVQCLATTTRGRPCAYVAVTDTKYCHLHADYDTNPPPRRGGSGGGINSSSVSGVQSINSTGLTVNLPFVVGSAAATTAGSILNNHTNNVPANLQNAIKIANAAAAAVGYSSQTSISTTSSPTSALDLGGVSGSSNTTLGRNMVEDLTNSQKDVLKNNNDPSSLNANGFGLSTTNTIDPTPQYPLLNSIPSDQWSNKKVLIGTGPLVNHVGRVLKWGNGWITVSTSTSGRSKGKNNTGVTSNNGSGVIGPVGEILHNRRAIELYLLPDDPSYDPPTIFKIDPKSGNNDMILNATTNATGSIVNVVSKTSDSHRPDVIISSKADLKQALSRDEQPSIQIDSISLVDTKVNDFGNVIQKNSIIDVENKSKEDTMARKTLLDDSNIQKDSRSIMNQISKQEENGRIQDVVANVTDTACSKDTKRLVQDSNSVILTLSQTPSTLKKFTDIVMSSSLPHEETSVVSNETKEEVALHEVQVSNAVSKDESVADISNQSIREQSMTKKAITDEQEVINDSSKKGTLTLMEELILAQTGRRVKNVDLVLCSGGGRTISKPKRYEDKTLIKKKRGRQNVEGKEDNSDSPHQRKKSNTSPSLKSSKDIKSSGSKSSCSKSPEILDRNFGGSIGSLKFKDSGIDTHNEKGSHSLTESQDDRCKVKA